MNHRIFWLWAMFLVYVPVLPNLVAKGMFGDGVHYAALARNLAEGSSEVWAPVCSTPSWGVLPMMPMMESVFFLHIGRLFLDRKAVLGVDVDPQCICPCVGLETHIGHATRRYSANGVATGFALGIVSCGGMGICAQFTREPHFSVLFALLLFYTQKF